MRARSQSRAAQRVAVDLASWSTATGESLAAPTEISGTAWRVAESQESHEIQQRLPSRASALISEVASSRRALVLFDADAHPLAAEWIA